MNEGIANRINEHEQCSCKAYRTDSKKPTKMNTSGLTKGYTAWSHRHCVCCRATNTLRCAALAAIGWLAIVVRWGGIARGNRRRR